MEGTKWRTMQEERRQFFEHILYIHTCTCTLKCVTERYYKLLRAVVECARFSQYLDLDDAS